MELSSTVEKAQLLIDLLLFFTSRFQTYDARLRIVLVQLADLFRVSWHWVVQEESALMHMLKSDVSAAEISSPRTSKAKKWAKVGAAVAISSSLFVVTAGLAAPALGAGIVALGAGSGVGAFIGYHGRPMCICLADVPGPGRRQGRRSCPA